MDTISGDQVDERRRRRRHSDEFKAAAVTACMQPGVSIAAVAMAHGVSANLLRRWVSDAEMKPVVRTAVATPSAMPPQLPKFDTFSRFPAVPPVRTFGKSTTWLRDLVIRARSL